MSTNRSARQPLGLRRVIFGAVCFIAFFLGILCASEGLVFAGDGSGASIPPLENPSKVANTDFAASGDLVSYEITFVKPARDYTVTIGLTDTLPVPFVLLTDTVATNIDVDELRVVTQTIGLIATFPPSDQETRVSLSYVAKVVDCTPLLSGQSVLSMPTTITAQNVAVLQELTNTAMVTPTTNFSTTSDTVNVTVPACGVYLPVTTKNYPEAPPFPTLVNGDLSQGPGVGWTEIVDSSAVPLIYPRSKIPAAVLNGNDSAYIAWLGGAPKSTNVLSQTVALPSNYYAALEFRYLSQSAEPNCNSDTAQMVANSPGNSEQLTVGFPLCINGDTEVWTGAHIDLTQFRGTTVTLAFLSKLNEARNSNWFLSNFVLCSKDKYSLAAGAPQCKY